MTRARTLQSTTINSEPRMGSGAGVRGQAVSRIVEGGREARTLGRWGQDGTLGRWGQAGFVLLTGAASVLALGFGSGLGAPPALDATDIGASTDVDGDGLDDVLEALLGTEMQLADTDADLINDLEELARGSDPLDYFSVPVAGEGDGVGLAARQDSDLFMLTTMLFIEGGVLSGKHLRITIASAALNGSVQFTTAQILALSEVSVFPGANSADKIVAIETPFPANLLEALGGFAVVGTVEGGVGGPILAATATTFVQSAGVLNAVSLMPAAASQGGSGSGVGVNPGLAYKPIAPADQLPETYGPQEVCVQSTSVGGSSGAVVTYVVETSECVEADGFCSPLCSTKGGSTVDIVDPLVLIGG